MSAVRVVISSRIGGSRSGNWVGYFSSVPTLGKLQDAVRKVQGSFGRAILFILRAAQPVTVTERTYGDYFTNWSNRITVAGIVIGEIQYENVSVTQLTEEETVSGFTRMGETVGEK